MGTSKRQKTTGDASGKHVDNNKKKKRLNHHSSLSDAIFGPSTTSSSPPSMNLTSSIFGADSKDDRSKSLFQNDFQKVAKKLQLENRKRQTEARKNKQEKSPSSQCDLTPDAVKERRKDLTRRSRKVVKSITVDISKYKTSDDEDDLSRDNDHGDRSDKGCVQQSSDDDEKLDPEGAVRFIVGRSSALFRKNGVIILKSLLRREVVVDELESAAEIVEQEVCQALDDKLGRDSYLPSSKPIETTQTKADEDGSFRFHEVASRCKGRLDIRYRMNEPPFCNLHPSCEEEMDNHRFSRIIWPLMKDLLGEDSQLVYMGLISSFPNSDDQPWHQDGTALFPDAPPDLIDQLPPYAINIFIPLRDLDEEMGLTEFWLASHCNDEARMALLEGQSVDMSNELIHKNRNIIGPKLMAGDALIYDYRICHRGTSNISTSRRPMLYLMYARPWFKEHLNFGTERLFLTSS
eukprot:scaffold1549_cov105-Cylindrotheca_fusiformis.AAC.9